ncbi:ficolin-2-like [Homarus americanus]|uniref:ficolin-2-like n=1 Tax=Homarus americanus TaxID=6706 RepID=UPI001C474054|nr:ficolin-2-like [Homarus americanus]
MVDLATAWLVLVVIMVSPAATDAHVHGPNSTEGETLHTHGTLHDPHDHPIFLPKRPQHMSRNCYDLYKRGFLLTGLYNIYPYDCCPERPVLVLCDMVTDGGGWTVIQHRHQQPRIDFYRTWMEYALGFGDLAEGEFWLGLDHIHALTNQEANEIRFDLEDFDGQTRWAKYTFFYVHDRNNDYKLEVNGYMGDAGDSFSTHGGQRFSAKDKDFGKAKYNCSVKYKGAWWYEKCHKSNLNGLYLSGPHASYADGINWKSWRGYHYSLRTTAMMIRPVGTHE